jgi:hypothetical protein
MNQRPTTTHRPTLPPRETTLLPLNPHARRAQRLSARSRVPSLPSPKRTGARVDRLRLLVPAHDQGSRAARVRHVLA